MRLAITGATGRIGSALVRHALEAGCEVRAADVRFQAAFPAPLTLTNLLDKSLLCSLLEGADAVVHLANAWNGHMPDTARTVSEATEMNSRLMATAVEMGVKRIIFASSVQVSAGTGIIEERCWPVQKQIAYLPMDGSLPARPSNGYALSKSVAEQVLRFHCDRSGITGIALRYPVVMDQHHLAKALEMFRKGRLAVGWTPMSLLEGCSHLTVADAARLTLACATAELSGYHCLFPTSTWQWPAPVQNIIEQYCQGIELRRPLQEIDNLVDLAQVTKLTGWTPLDKPFLL
jgi:nucleoside-diphosphate-sugar epimerase